MTRPSHLARRRPFLGLLGATALAALISVSGLCPAQANGDALITYSGLRVYEDGSSTLRVNITRDVPVAYSRKGTRLTFLIKGAKVELRNNKNPLRAEFFRSNVVRAKLDDTKDGASLNVTLRGEIEPEHKMLRHSGGAILRIDIPPQPAKK